MNIVPSGINEIVWLYYATCTVIINSLC